MFSGLEKSVAQSVIQDLATAGAAWLGLHGFLGAGDTQGFIGSVCFLGMLAVNAYLQHTQTKGN